MTRNRYAFSDETLKEAFSQGLNMPELLKLFKFDRHNSRARKYLKEQSVRLNLPIDVAVRNMVWRNLSEILVLNGPDVNTGSLKQALIKEGLLKNECSCGIGPIWNDKVINLHLDHQNGNSKDNRIENLRILCPNCHSQTDTYCARSSGGYKTVTPTNCLRCNEISLSGNYCRACSPLVPAEDQIAVLPTLEVMLEEISTTSIAFVSTKYSKSRDFFKARFANPENYDPITLAKKK